MRKLLFLFLCLAPIANAATHYIRAGASGANNGTSWADAWTSFASVTWTRGDTYYLAGGSYDENVTIAKANSGTTWITIKKANAADNSGDAGWNAAYASTQAVITGRFAVQNDYIEIDGVTGTGVIGHGIKLQDLATQGIATLMYSGGASGAIKLYHVEVRNGTHTTPRGINVVWFSGTYKNIHIADCWLHSSSMNGVAFPNMVGTSYSDYSLLFENNVVSETGGAINLDHGQGIQIQSTSSYHIFRNNVFRNNSGTAMIAYLGVGTTYSDAQIYNNIFYKDDIASYPTISPGTIYTRDTSTSSDFLIANNTFYGLGNASYTGTLAGVFLDGTESGHVLQNNIWENSRFNSSGNSGLATTSTNGYYNNSGTPPSGTPSQVNGSATTFASASTGDFRIATGGYAESAGLDLSDTFTTDLYGTTRSGWNLGAIESATAPDVIPFEAVASVVMEGDELLLDFTAPATAGANGPDGVTLSATGGAVTATRASGDGTTFWRYDLSRTIESWEVLTWSYSTANGIENAAGIDLAAVSGGHVRNYVYPLVVSKVIPEAGTTFVVTVDQDCVTGTGFAPTAAGTLSASGGAVTLGNFSSDATGRIWTSTLSRTIDPGETVTWSYSKANGIMDEVTGNTLVTRADIVGAAVTNNSGGEVEDPPTAPSGLSATATSSSSISLTWTDNSDNETGFEMERSANGSTGWSQIATPAANATSASDTGLSASTAYYYRIRAVNASGNSAYSSTANTTTDGSGGTVDAPANPRKVRLFIGGPF